MDTGSVWEILAQIPAGKIVAWGAVIITILGTVCTMLIKLFGVFKKFNRMQEEDEKFRKMIISHDEMFKGMKDSLDEIKKSMTEQKDVNLRQVRYTIVHTCDDALSDGYISAGKFKSLEELYEEYIDIFHGNGYVKIMMEKVRALPVRGSLD